jgi:NAD-dependent dihydropyrimidine dehydrogenase PreA subunit
MRLDGIFIGVEVDDESIARDPDFSGHLAQVCPVDIFREPVRGQLEIVEKNVDECVLCRLCMDVAHLDVADDAVKVIKLYDGGAVLR